MSKSNEFQGLKEQVKRKRGCVGNGTVKSCKMCKACSGNKEHSKYTNIQIEK